MTDISTRPPFWVTQKVPTSPLSPTLPDAADLSRFDHLISEAATDIEQGVKDRQQSLVKAKDWFVKSKVTGASTLINEAKGVLENNPFASIELNSGEVEIKEYFQFLVMHPFTGGVEQLKAEVLRVLNKSELNYLNKSPVLMTGAVLYGAGSSNTSFADTIINYINMITMFFGNNPTAQGAMMALVNTPQFGGLSVPNASDMLDKPEEEAINQIVENAMDTASSLNKLMQPKSFLGQFLKKSKNDKDKLQDNILDFKATSLIDQSELGMKSTMFKSTAKFGDDGVSVTNSRKVPINKWIKVEKINQAIEAINEQMRGMKDMLNFVSGASEAASGMVELAFDKAIKQVKDSETIMPPILSEMSKLVNEVGLIGADLSFNALMIPPHSTRKPDFEKLMQTWISKENAPVIETGSHIYGALILCYTDSEIVSNIAYEGIKLFLGGSIENG